MVGTNWWCTTRRNDVDLEGAEHEGEGDEYIYRMKSSNVTGRQPLSRGVRRPAGSDRLSGIRIDLQTRDYTLLQRRSRVLSNLENGQRTTDNGQRTTANLFLSWPSLGSLCSYKLMNDRPGAIARDAKAIIYWRWKRRRAKSA